MKCVMYISHVAESRHGASVPSSLSEIYMRARRVNEKHNVTGALAYKNGRYLQIIEGDNQEVNQLYLNIRADSRHQRIVTLLDISIDHRSFPGKPMRLVNTLQQDAEINHFFTRYKHIIAKAKKESLTLLGGFYTLSSADSVKPLPHSEKFVTIKSWPNFTLIEQTNTAVKLSVHLKRGFQSYAKLVTCGEFGTKEDVDRALSAFRSLDILEIDENKRSENSIAYTAPSGGFYTKMKRFLQFR